MADIYDIHNHLLPGVDDGPKEFSESIRICKIAESQNTKSVIVTPHRKDVTENLSVNIIKDLVSDINQTLREDNVDINIKIGMENHIDLGLLRDVDDGRALTLNNGQYILVEMPWQGRPSYIEEIIADLLGYGLTPVLAHPERMNVFEEEPNLLFDFVQMGCISQLTASSLYGKFGNTAMNSSIDIMRHGLAHVIASDTHMVEGQRCYDMELGFSHAKRIVGIDIAKKMCSVNPLAILENQKLT